ncbi:MAG TPA: MarR family transcriptional regulator [Solirubrobacteraceae bacterium]|jgi:DNA-binding MarR family transcriptional regulator|nr:MarR family transcriptional regulator [Solirubrobacteraceae bacterium]
MSPATAIPTAGAVKSVPPPPAQSGPSAPAQSGPSAPVEDVPAVQSIGGADLCEVGQRAWRSLQRAHASLARRVDAELERTHGLPLSTYEALHRLAESPGGRMRMCDLAEHAQLSRSGLTRLADRLEKEGLLERCSCEHDARGAYACLTDLGRDRLAAARGTHLAVVREQFLSRFSERELGALAELWDRIAPCRDC